jgi:uncharacterized protein
VHKLQVKKIKLLDYYSRHVEFICTPLTDVSQRGVFGSQVIHLAAFANQCDHLLDALELGADIDAIGDLGLCPLHYAVLGSSEESIHLLLLRGAKTNILNEFLETPAQMAYILNQTKIMNALTLNSKESIFISDDKSIAHDRWLEFKAMQEKNFWKND